MANDKVKGLAPRIISVPGYHVHPQYDLVHLRHLVTTRRAHKRQFVLNLAPMVDMFSVLVIFLLMNFSSSGDVYFVSQNISLPRAAHGKPLLSLPLVAIIGNKVIFNADDEEKTKFEEINDEKVPQLRTWLKKYKNFEAQLAPGAKFNGKINLQSDVNTSVDEIKKVMRVLMQEGWSGINFVVDPTKK